MKKLKKRFIVPAVVFILGMCALIGAIYVVGKSQEQQNRTNAKLNAMTYTERIKIKVKKENVDDVSRCCYCHSCL